MLFVIEIFSIYRATYAVVLADAHAATLLALASYAVVLADVLADVRPAACSALASLAVMRALCAPLLQSASS